MLVWECDWVLQAPSLTHSQVVHQLVNEGCSLGPEGVVIGFNEPGMKVPRDHEVQTEELEGGGCTLKDAQTCVWR